MRVAIYFHTSFICLRNMPGKDSHESYCVETWTRLLRSPARASIYWAASPFWWNTTKFCYSCYCSDFFPQNMEIKYYTYKYGIYKSKGFYKWPKLRFWLELEVFRDLVPFRLLILAFVSLWEFWKKKQIIRISSNSMFLIKKSYVSKVFAVVSWLNFRLKLRALTREYFLLNNVLELSLLQEKESFFLLKSYEYDI